MIKLLLHYMFPIRLNFTSSVFQKDCLLIDDQKITLFLTSSDMYSCPYYPLSIVVTEVVNFR